MPDSDGSLRAERHPPGAASGGSSGGSGLGRGVRASIPSDWMILILFASDLQLQLNTYPSI
ncbi:hypothetical protein [Rhodopseudomonas pseudopalustris]|uniref:hypothetical protein n=1 Tax=Rhodopseudomonas pseudopalustris TaxID=1513892 RepID=UPI001FCD1723|nr:hypothetical protein [Rhodopseudomonas pseudopalustris]